MNGLIILINDQLIWSLTEDSLENRKISQTNKINKKKFLRSEPLKASHNVNLLWLSIKFEIQYGTKEIDWREIT